MRIDPPASVANAITPIPAAMEAAAPPLEPPERLVGSHGLRAIPVSGPFDGKRNAVERTQGLVLLPALMGRLSRSQRSSGITLGKRVYLRLKALKSVEGIARNLQGRNGAVPIACLQFSNAGKRHFLVVALRISSAHYLSCL